MDIWGCQGEPHRCGKMIVGNTIQPRCQVYAKDYKFVIERGTKYLDWWQIITASPVIAATHSPYARPQNCIRAGKLVDSMSTSEPYIAISYVWDTCPSFQDWGDRRVTKQALRIAERLSRYTPYALWIDAICIPQDDEPVKMVEVGKMADIYRSATAVLCLVSETERETCEIVGHAAALMDMDGFRALEEAGDTHGMYMFASQGSNEALRRLFGSRWWTRAWTFQEAVLNKTTFVVGEEMETIPISDILKICRPIGRRAATQRKEVLGQPSAFWDSLDYMKIATNEQMALGTAMSSVWRRQCTVNHDMVYSLLGVCRLEAIQPDYQLPLEEVFTDLVEKASSKGDFSWLRWSHLVDRDGSSQRMSMVPLPATVSATPASAITEWRSIQLSPKPSSPIRGGEFGVCIPHRSTGVVRWQSQPEGIPETINTLQNLSHSPEEIWNSLFGMHVGLASDIDRAAGGLGLAQSLLTLTSGYVDGSFDESSSSHDDMVGDRPYTRGYGFTSYASMATKVWTDTRLVVMQSQGGTTVVRASNGAGQARIHKLPVESRSGICLCLVVHDSTRYRASAVGVMIEKEHAGSGAWQLTRFS
ncbi:hypothetical protein HYDPIDRAFT_117168 [Hydnomerulius pinastri MD-312]|uniref:Heterokaryon incompatibility domain-containing protein n=1 Tax=Hydnomerulius pinastri MD-312 TaxID=994086 RepID=A0A0C9WAY3_9AGAM|nr:hypothetical protein HYDPIDRAFT_117168 [Hydnomerulius pinastri MD-312]